MVLDLLTMKRGREEEEEADQNMKSMAISLMLLANGGGGAYDSSATARVFECKTCNRQFPSFQALGGHRASHKKPRLAGENSGEMRTSPVKPKTHECPVCGLEFAIGQALGGHMRRHRTAAVNDQIVQSHQQQPGGGAGLGLSLATPPIVKRSNSRSLDLNLTPSVNKFLLFGKMVPIYAGSMS